MMRLFYSLIFLSLIFVSCEEIPPAIDFSVPDLTLLDTTYVNVNVPTPQEKHVLVEELTGIACTGCPGGHIKLEEIEDNYGDRVEVISIHPKGVFTNPQFYNQFDLDLTTDAGEDIVALFGGYGGQLPQGIVDRVVYSDQSDIKIGTASVWIVKVGERLSSDSKVNISIENANYDESSKEARVKVKLHYTEAIQDDQYLSVYLLEDSIVAPQLNGNLDGEWELSYTHRHTLRALFSNSLGDLLNAELEVGRVFEKEYKLTIDDSWDSHHLHVLASVHYKSDSNNVVNVRSAHVGH